MPMDSANQEVWIGVDVGTTGVRAIAYTEEGTNVCSSEAFYPLLTPHPDWAEDIITAFAEYMEKYGVPGYNEEVRRGVLRHIVVRELALAFCRQYPCGDSDFRHGPQIPS